MSGTVGGLNHPIVVAPWESRFWTLPEGVSLAEPEGRSPGATHPAGFLASGVVAGMKQSGSPDVGVLTVAPEWRAHASSAAVFTTNAFAAAPIIVNRTQSNLGGLTSVAMNSANANACTGAAGLEVARAMQRTCAEVLRVPVSAVAVGSTGIIGVQPDEALIMAGIRKAAAALRSDGGWDFNRSIMTTDRFPKICALNADTDAGSIRLGVCAKGAGMLAPAMATMMCVATTDAQLTPEEMRSLLAHAVEGSFHRITVDGEMSTNDCVLFLASGASGVRPQGASLTQLGAALDAMLLRIALMMVADGEGATKSMRVRVVGADTDENAVRVARAIAGSPLVKTAMHGGDPNWGRIISSAGAVMAGRSLPKAALQLCDVTVVEESAAAGVSDSDALRLKAGMQQPEIDIGLDLGLGSSSTELFFADMGHEYITINAEYHT